MQCHPEAESKALREAETMLEAVSFKKATEGMGRVRVARDNTHIFIRHVSGNFTFTS